MKLISEGTWQTTILQEFRSLGFECLCKTGNVREGRGWPDLYIAAPRFHGWVELKVGKNTLSTAQEQRIARLLQNGVPALVLRLLPSDDVRLGPLVEAAESASGARLGAVYWQGQRVGPDGRRGLERIELLRRCASWVL